MERPTIYILIGSNPHLWEYVKSELSRREIGEDETKEAKDKTEEVKDTAKEKDKE